MRLIYFIPFITTLYLLEAALIPGLLTVDPILHISLLLVLTFVYQAWTEWIAGLLIFTLLLAFTVEHTHIALFILYAAMLGISFLLTQSVLGTRSLTSFLVYTLIMSFLLSLAHVILFGLPPAFFVGHLIFSSSLMLLARSFFPVRQPTFLSRL